MQVCEVVSITFAKSVHGQTGLDHACSVNGIWSCRRSTHKEMHVFYKNVEHIELDAKFLSHVSFKFRDLEDGKVIQRRTRSPHRRWHA